MCKNTCVFTIAVMQHGKQRTCPHIIEVSEQKPSYWYGTVARNGWPTCHKVSFNKKGLCSFDASKPEKKSGTAKSSDLSNAEDG
jgi:hypothetical protein